MCVKNVFRGVLNYLTHCTVREVIGVPPPPSHTPAALAPGRVSEASRCGALLETTRTARPSEAARRGKSRYSQHGVVKFYKANTLLCKILEQSPAVAFRALPGTGLCGGGVLDY